MKRIGQGCWLLAGMVCLGALAARGQPPVSDHPSSVDLGPTGQTKPVPQELPRKLPDSIGQTGDKMPPLRPVPGPKAAIPKPGGKAAEPLPLPRLVPEAEKKATEKPSAQPPLTPLDPSLYIKETLTIPGLKLNEEIVPIDLKTALNLAGVSNPHILIARQRVVTALAERQFAAAQILPSLNLGTSYDDHAGPTQQSDGNILNVNRNAFFAGFGAYAIAAGTVNIPGLVWNLNVSDKIFNFLEARQFVEQMRFANRAMENEMLRQVAVAYTDLLRAEGRRALALLIRIQAQNMSTLISNWAKYGAGREADKQRALSELAHRDVELVEMEGQVLRASTRLAKLLNLNPATRLHVVDGRVVPMGIVPDPIPLSELLAIALLNRPEMLERRAAIRRAFLSLRAAKVLPFSPNLIIGLSYGAFGGGSDLVVAPETPATPFGRGTSRFGNNAERMDFDAIGYWMLTNMGVGNLAMIREARANLKISDLEFLAMMDTVRSQVARAYAQTHARFAQIDAGEKAIRAIDQGYKEDFEAIFNKTSRPIELLDSLRLLADARVEYLEAIIRYNQAQIDLFVALGQPPADVLARPVPATFLPPTEQKKGDAK